MTTKYLWMCLIGALALGALLLLRLKFGNGANTAITSFSLTSAVIFAVYYIQTFVRKAERDKWS